MKIKVKRKLIVNNSVKFKRCEIEFGEVRKEKYENNRIYDFVYMHHFCVLGCIARF